MAAPKALTARADPKLVERVNEYCTENGLSQQDFVSRSARLHIEGDASALIRAHEGDRCLVLDASTAAALGAFSEKGDFDFTRVGRRILRQHLDVDGEDGACACASREAVDLFRHTCRELGLDEKYTVEQALLLIVESHTEFAQVIVSRLQPEIAMKLAAFREARDESSIHRVVESALIKYMDSVLEFDNATRERYERLLGERRNNLN